MRDREQQMQASWANKALPSEDQLEDAAAKQARQSDRGKLQHGSPRQGQVVKVEDDDEPAANAAAASTKRDVTLDPRAEKVKEAFVHSWLGYTKFASGRDELKPLSQQGVDSFHMALTPIDAMDTMLVMGLHEEFVTALEMVLAVKYDNQEDINLFETTIRVLGGLLSSYSLLGSYSGADAILSKVPRQQLLDKATELADSMMFAFDTPTGLPFGTLGLGSRRKTNPSWSGGASTIAEVGTLQLEWQYLSLLTGKPQYAEKVNKVTEVLDGMEKPLGLYPMFVDPSSGSFTSQTITFGARGDSIYEYFLKQWVLMTHGGKSEPEDPVLAERVRRMYVDTMKSMITYLVKQSSPSGLVYIAEMEADSKTAKGKMDHLVCFVPGMLALGVHTGAVRDAATREEHTQLAKDLMHTCREFYVRMATGLSPELVQFQDGNDFIAGPGAHHNLLRPETVESLMYMYRLTGDVKYQQWGWEMFESWVRHSKVSSGGFACIKDVTVEGNAEQSDKMESFWLAETLKYLYLLFSPPSTLSLEDWVFNTEAHPLLMTAPH